MKLMGKQTILISLMLSALSVNSVWADEAALNQRIDRLERIIQGQGLVSLLGRVDQLQNEIQRLNGENESLNHKIDQMKKRQRDLYLDIDQRLEAQAKVAETAPVVLLEEPTTEQQVEPPVIEQVPAEQVQQAEQTAPVSIENGEAAYQAALQTLRRGQYEQAITALAAFPEQYPQSSYLPNTYYWQGEANYVLRNFDLAVVAFQTVIDRFPASSKVADATLKLGFSQYELGEVAEATVTLTSVVDNYPNTSVSRLATVRLDRIKQANR